MVHRVIKTTSGGRKKKTPENGNGKTLVRSALRAGVLFCSVVAFNESDALHNFHHTFQFVVGRVVGEGHVSANVYTLNVVLLTSIHRSITTTTFLYFFYSFIGLNLQNNTITSTRFKYIQNVQTFHKQFTAIGCIERVESS